MSNFFASNFPQGYPTGPSRGVEEPFTDVSPPPAGPGSGSGSGMGMGMGMGQSSAASPQFDIFEWHVAYQSCQRYFLDHAQHDNNVQAVAALVNIQLPFQWTTNPIVNSVGPLPHSSAGGAYNLPWPRNTPVANNRGHPSPIWVSLVPFIRRLVITGMDREGIMHGFFGDDWRKGVGPAHECERRNYLFAAKSGGWSKVKMQYDMSPQESVPFLKPLQDVQMPEIEAAEKTWSQWLAMEDWMVGPRAPDVEDHQSRETGRRRS